MYNDIDYMKHYRNFDFDPNFPLVVFAPLRLLGY